MSDFYTNKEKLARALNEELDLYREQALLYRGEFNSSQTYRKNSLVTHNGYIGIANVETTDDLQVGRIGAEYDVYPVETPPTTQSIAKQVVFGTSYQSGDGYWLEGYRVNVIAGNHYEVLFVCDPDGENEVSFLNSFLATTTGWRDFGLLPRLIKPNKKYEILVILQEPDVAPADTIYNFNYRKQNNTTVVDSGEMLHSSNDSSILHTSKFDSDAVDRTAFLQGLIVGDLITSNNRTWSIQSVVEDVDRFRIEIAPAQRASGSSGIRPITFTTVSNSTLTYVKDTDYWLSNFVGEVHGLLGVDVSYNDVVETNDAMGVDIVIQEADISPDWDIISVLGHLYEET